MASGFGAGAGADMLQDVLRRKLVEQAQIAQQQQAAAKLAEEVRQANMQNQVQQGNLTLGNRRVDEDSRQFNEQAPLRIAQVGHLNADTTELQRRPQAEQQQREFTTGRDKTQHGYQLEETVAQGNQRMREIGAQQAGAMKIAGMKQAAAGQPTQQQANEVQDSLALIDQIVNDPALPKSVGPIDQYVGGVISGDPAGVNRFRALNDQLVGKLSLAQAGKLKGQGQISDKERAMLGAAATALRQGLSEQDYKNELAKVRAQFARMVPGAAAPQPAHDAAGGPKVGDVKVFPNGKKGVWDGQGWVAQ